MIENQILHIQVCCHLTCIFYCGVMLLIWLEFIRLSVETECLMQEPCTVLSIFLLQFIVRLISATGQFLILIQLHTKSKLLCLCRVNIEKCYFLSNDLTFFPIFYYDHMQTIIYIFHLLRRENFACHLFQDTDYFFVSVNCSFSFVFSSVHILKDHTHHPDNSKKMIDMLMCYENISHIHPVKSCCF